MPLTASQRRSASLAALLASALEWYDFAVFGYLAGPLGQAFFPAAGGALPLLAAFAVFASGYLMRPVGSLVLGPIGDRLGRRALLSLAVALMGAASLGIAVLPTAAHWGWAAAALLLALRLLQGLSLGAAFTGSVTYASEAAPPGREGLQAAVAVAGGQGGFLIGSLSVALLAAVLGQAELVRWGWRLPFAFGALVGLLGLGMRQALPETLEPPEAGAERAPAAARPWAALMEQPLRLLEIAALVAFANVVFYVLFLYAVDFHSHPPFGPGPRGVNHPAQVNALTSVTQALGLGAVIAGGWLCDRLGPLRANLLSTRALLLVTPLAVPLALLDGVRGLVAGQLLGGLPALVTIGAQAPLVLASLPAERRCTVYSMAYSLAMAVAGGTAPLLCGWMLEVRGWSWGPALYASLYALPAFWALHRFRRRAGEDHGRIPAPP